MQRKDDLKKEYVDLGTEGIVSLRVGTVEQWKERLELQQSNTASSLRAKVVSRFS